MKFFVRVIRDGVARCAPNKAGETRERWLKSFRCNICLAKHEEEHQ
jgi:hypothetical protein